MTRIIKDTIKKLLAHQGYALSKIRPNPATMDSALRSVAQRKPTFKTVIDVGASNGCWSENLMRYVPQCRYLLIEAQSCHRDALQEFQRQHQNVEVALAAAGETVGEIYFDAGAPLAGQASFSPFAANNVIVPCTTIDKEVQSRELPGPYLIKLDTHGFELPILRGAASTIASTETMIIECYNFRLTPETLLFYEMCEYMSQFGFRCIDLVDPLHRPWDGIFWQMDLVFARVDRPEFEQMYPDGKIEQSFSYNGKLESIPSQREL